MFNKFLRSANELTEKREPFAIAFVVHRLEPSSGKPGDKAIIKQDGEIIGWIGGGCTRGIIIKEALASIEDGNPRMVRISPDESLQPQSGILDYKMTCHSGGTVEVYIEPVMPKPHLVVIGKSIIAKSLVRLARAMDYTVSLMAVDIDAAAFPEANFISDKVDLTDLELTYPSYIVVSTQGEGDEQALEQALKKKVPYLAFVASRKKAQAVYSYLRQKGITTAQLQSIKTPAGIDINAKLPEEIAVSILAEIIQHMRSKKKEALPEIMPEKKQALKDDFFINPVCQIPVHKATAKHVIKYEGEQYYFCCDGCKVAFEKEPAKYAGIPE